jgi:two-component system NtrC family response regulator
MAKVLIIDDDPDFGYALSRTTQRLGHNTLVGQSIAEGYEIVRQETVDAVFLDVLLPDGNGLSMLPNLSALPSSPEIIIITGAGDASGAELAISNGAWDYIDKSTSAKDIALALKRALAYRSERLLAAGRGIRMALRREHIIGSSSAIAVCLDQVAQSAISDVNVLISGETGTGKDLFARAIHDNSARSEAPFIVVDCAALPENLIESLLFGHCKGAFTGADSEKQGLVVQAHDGTLFLDEVGELPPGVQKAFLRVLQERLVRPVGSIREVASNFRLVAATNRNLEEMVVQGAFRKDLFFRIQSFCIQLPGLRQRSSDIRSIASHHINHACKRLQLELKGISNAFFEVLESYTWPGNIRELVNVVEQALIAAGGEPTLYPKHLPTKLRIHVKQAAFSGTDGPSSDPIDVVADTGDTDNLPPLQKYRESVVSVAERQYLEKLMSHCQGKIKAALNISGLSQSRLYALLQKYALTPSKVDQSE